MSFITIQDQRLFYTHQGKLDSKELTLLLIHGAGGTHLDWPPELRKIEGYRTVAVDLPGHGRSDPPGCSSIEGYSNIISLAIEKLGLERIVLVGHSMGGAIVQEIGLRCHPQVVGLVLVATGARLKVDPAILNRLLTDYDEAVEVVVEYAWSEGAPAELQAQGRQMLMQNDPAIVYGDYSACNNFDVMQVVSRINLPTLVISGTSDRLTPLKYSQHLAEILPAARLEIVENAGHMVMLERPAQVSDAIRNFAEELVL